MNKDSKSKLITNGRTRIEINQQGAVIDISDVKSGHVYFDAGKSKQNLFQLVVPSPTWTSRSIMPSCSAPPKINDNAEACVLYYDNMQMGGAPTGINVEIRFELKRGTDEILMTLKLSNHGDETIAGVIFPWVNGWKSPGNPSLDCMMLGPCGKVDPASLPKWCCAWGNGTHCQNSTSSSYPESLMVPWIDFSGENGGISCINYQEKPRNSYATITKDTTGLGSERHLGFLLGFYAYSVPGSDWESPAIGISVHDGDWHQTADRYREWMTKRISPAKSPRKFREAIGSQHVFFNYFDGTPVRSYGSLPEIAAVGRKYGVSELCVWDRLSLGTYARFAHNEDLLQYNPEDRQTLTRCIHEAVEAGSDVSALINFRLINTALDVTERENYKSEVQTALNGSKKMESYPCTLNPGNFGAYHLGPYCDVFSPFSKKYRQRVLKKIDEYLEMGYSSLFYDQPFETAPDYSRKDKGGVPEMTYAETLELIREVRERLKEKNPDAVIMGEQSEVFASEIIDQWMCWVWSDRDIEAAIRLYYSCPRTVINCVVDSDAGLASHAFSAGLHLMLMVKGGFGYLADVPEFAGHVRKLADLRKRCAVRTVHARFCESRGFSIEANDNIVAYSYESPEGPAMIFAAPQKAGHITVRLDRTYFSYPGKADQGKIFRLGGSESEITGDVQRFELDKHEVVVWFA